MPRSKDPDGSSDANGVQVVARVAEILRILSGSPDGRSLAEIAAEVRLPRSTVHRLVKALEQERFASPVSAAAGFRLGPGLLELASTGQEWVAGSIHGYLVELAEQVDETVDLAVLSHGGIIFVDQVMRPQRLRAVSAIGAIFPLHSTANGKAVLAQLDDEAVMAHLPRRLERMTKHTITSVPKLLEELQRVRETGLAWDREENDPGICAVGTAIENPLGMRMAVTIPVPVPRFSGREKQLGSALLDARKKIEARLWS